MPKAPVGEYSRGDGQYMGGGDRVEQKRGKETSHGERRQLEWIQQPSKKQTRRQIKRVPLLPYHYQYVGGVCRVPGRIITAAQLAQ